MIEKEIPIEYQLIKGSKLLLCANCSEYKKEIELIDLTAFASKPQYKELKLLKYEEDEFIVPAATYKMIAKNGKVEIYKSNDEKLILDSIAMKNKFMKYAITTKLHPKLINRAALQKLIK